MSDVKRIYIAHTINAVALSIISVYIPAYLLSLGFSLPRVIEFFVLLHGVGLIYALGVFPLLVKKWGLLHTFKIYYPFQILHFLLLSLMKTHPISLELVALLGGVANFAYWLPMNIFFIRSSHSEEMGSNLSKLFSFPLIFSIIGPLISAVLIPFVGFWIVFVITIVLLLVTFVPLAKIQDSEIAVAISFSKSWQRLSRNKMLFVFEFLDNVIEESEWFWGVYVFLIIGSLESPGIVGSLQAIGGAIFTFLIGKFAHKHGTYFVPLAAIMLLLLTIGQMVSQKPWSAYIVTVAISLAMTMFLVSYFSSVYKKVKDDDEEEFMILREIPTVLGRLVVFIGIYLTFHNLRLFFFVPLVAALLLLVLYLLQGKKTFLIENSEATLSTK